jgi:hypothetical protein
MLKSARRAETGKLSSLHTKGTGAVSLGLCTQKTRLSRAIVRPLDAARIIPPRMTNAIAFFLPLLKETIVQEDNLRPPAMGTEYGPATPPCIALPGRAIAIGVETTFACREFRGQITLDCRLHLRLRR